MLLQALATPWGAGADASACNLTGDWAMPDGHGHLAVGVAADGTTTVSGRCCDDRGGAQLTCVGEVVGTAITFNFTQLPSGKKHIGPQGNVAVDCRHITFGPNPKEAWQRWPPLPVPPPPPAPPPPPPPPPPPAPPSPHHAVPAASSAEVVAAGKALLARVLPGHATMFHVEAIPCDSDSGNEALEYEAAPASSGAAVTLRGCTGVAVASALNWYLKEEVRTHEAPSWSALPPLRGLPAVLPSPRQKQRRVLLRAALYQSAAAPSHVDRSFNRTGECQQIDL